MKDWEYAKFSEWAGKHGGPVKAVNTVLRQHTIAGLALAISFATTAYIKGRLDERLKK